MPSTCITYFALNVMSLSRRLETILALGRDCFILSEVRVSLSQQATLARRAARCGYQVVWSAPPPPTPTAAVAPGGTAIFVKFGLGVSELRVPEIDKWHAQGRACAVKMTLQNVVVCLIAVYGFAPSHPQRQDNEALCLQIASWITKLTIPVIWAGDFNTTAVNSPILTLLRAYDLWRISSDSSSTRGKTSSTSGKSPIDHVICNSQMLDLAICCDTLPGEPISDHVPLGGHFTIVGLGVSDAPKWRWAKEMAPLKHIVEEIAWDFTGNSYTQWAEYAVDWLSRTYHVCKQSKVSLGVADRKCAVQRLPQVYKKLRRLRGWLLRLEKSFVPSLWDKACWSLVDQHCTPPTSVEEMRQHIRGLEKDMYDSLQKKALAEWRDRVKSWHAQSFELYKYLRNETPAKCTGILHEGVLTMHPTNVEAALEAFWGNLESWPTDNSLVFAIDVVEDVYSLFFPHFPFAAGVTCEDVTKQLEKKKRSASGPDGWTRRELKALPRQAIAQVLRILSTTEGWKHSLLTHFKRVPICKNPLAPPTADNFRPIDVFSHLLRLLTSAQVAALRPWLTKVLHRSQYASDRGALAAVADLNVEAECTLHGYREVWAFTADFSKLYNTQSLQVCLKVAELMGLDLSSVPLLWRPLAFAKGCWRLPQDSVSPFRMHSRGLPQGMATSVILSELCVAAFLWRLHAIVNVKTICYVDDLNVIASSRDTMMRAYELLESFTQDLSLSLAHSKTKFWGTYPTMLKQEATRKGVAQVDVLCALGLEWPLTATVKPDYKKEMMRISHCRERLKRLAHLPALPSVKLQAIVTGCLSLLSFSVLPESKHVTGLRVSVRHAMGQPHGSPEILFHVLNRTSADPLYTWIVACIRLLKTWYETMPVHSLALLRSKKALCGRTSAFLRWAKRANWTIKHNYLEVTGCGFIRLSRVWSEVREEIRETYRRSMMAAVVKRRPLLYEGLRDLNHKEHRKFISSLSPHSASLILRVWSGAAMTASHAHTVGARDAPTCECGAERQTVKHLVFDCRLG